MNFTRFHNYPKTQARQTTSGVKNVSKQWEKLQTSQAENARSAAPQTNSLLTRAEQLLRSGKPNEAVALCRQRLAEEDTDALAQELLGAALVAAGLHGEAESAFERLLALAPGHVRASIWLVGAKVARGQVGEGVRLLTAASQRSHHDPDALREIGDAYVRLGLVEDALDLYAQATAMRPNDPQIVFKEARALQMLSRNEEALAKYRRVLSLRPDVASAYSNIAEIRIESGFYEEGREHYEKAIRYTGGQGAGFRYRRAALTPIIAESNAQIDEVRRRIKTDLEALRMGRVRLRDPHMEIGSANFYLTYHGRQNRGLQELAARTYLAACPDLGWTARHEPRAETGRIRIGICSAFLHEHTIGRVTLGLLKNLDRKRFEVLLFRTGLQADSLSYALDAAVDRAAVLGGTLDTARKTLASANLDILFYPDIGMDAFTYFLAFARLAPVQIAGWGHPDTTGIPSIDYYFSAATFEPTGAQEHYSERLIALPRIYAHMNSPEARLSQLTKRSLGFDETAKLYLCAQTLFKVHPDFDAALAGILDKDPSGQVVFFETSEPNWVHLLQKRFARTIPEHHERIHFLPRLSLDDFQRALRIADAVIDTKHFTGGYTAYLAFANHVPVVTWDGELMRGRMTQGLYRQMGVDGLSAPDDETFSSLAVKLATDVKFSKDARDRIAGCANLLFRDEASIRDFEGALLAAHSAAQEGRRLDGWDDSFRRAGA